ncbi:MAG: hypothetical protein LBD85_04680 [Oscillospiraceae bacterium]|jgi:hypothetical protein|nr:hypothetical protein [Oscillospiraceae bacterium]
MKIKAYEKAGGRAVHIEGEYCAVKSICTRRKKTLDTAIPAWYNANIKIYPLKGDYPKW